MAHIFGKNQFTTAIKCAGWLPKCTQIKIYPHLAAVILNSATRPEKILGKILVLKAGVIVSVLQLISRVKEASNVREGTWKTACRAQHQPKSTSSKQV